MPWVKISDDATEHPKLRKAGPNAVALWLAGLCYCARHLTDGHIPKDDLEDVYRPKGRRFRYKAAAKELVAVQLWDDIGGEGGSYRVHNYHNYQPSRDEVLAKREQDAERKRDFRKAKNARKQAKNASRPPRTPNGTPSGVTPDVQPESEGESAPPVPDPTRPDPGNLPTGSEDFELPGVDHTQLHAITEEAHKAKARSALPEGHKWRPWGDHWKRAAAWAEKTAAIRGHGDPVQLYRDALAAFYADDKMRAKGYPLALFLNQPDSWLVQPTTGPGADPVDYDPDRDGLPKDPRNYAAYDRWRDMKRRTG